MSVLWEGVKIICIVGQGLFIGLLVGKLSISIWEGVNLI